MSSIRYLGPGGEEIEESFLVTNGLLHGRAERLGITQDDVRRMTNEIGTNYSVPSPEVDAFFFDKVPKSELVFRATDGLELKSKLAAPSGIATLNPDGTLVTSQRVPDPPQLQPRFYISSGTITAVTTSSKVPQIANRVATIEVDAQPYAWFPMIFGYMPAKRDTGDMIPRITVTDEFGIVVAEGLGNDALVENLDPIFVGSVDSPTSFQPGMSKMFSVYLHGVDETDRTGQVSSSTQRANFSCMIVPA